MDVSPVTLQGNTIFIEPLNESHAQGLYDIGQVADDWLYMPRPCFQSVEDTLSWIAEAQQLAAEKTHISFVIRRKADQKILGSTRFLNIRCRDRSLEIGYTWLGKEAQRTQVNTEAKLLLLGHAFETLKAIRVELKTDARNLRSQQAITRLGAKREGVFRKHMIVQNGYIRDSVYFSIIDDEWAVVKTRLQQLLSSP